VRVEPRARLRVLPVQLKSSTTFACLIRVSLSCGMKFVLPRWVLVGCETNEADGVDSKMVVKRTLVLVALLYGFLYPRYSI
jgi:hypothetical protein